jgi:hypothetical protein
VGGDPLEDEAPVLTDSLSIFDDLDRAEEQKLQKD